MRFFRNWNRFVTLGGIFISLLVCGLGMFFVSKLPFSTLQPDVESQVTIIPVSTYTPTPDQEVVIGSSQTEIHQTADGIQTGVYVQITGTNGEGLRIRSNPGLNAEVNFYGMDNEVFLVQDGPIEADGYTWWFIAAPYDTNRSGWSAAYFLTIIEQ